MMFRVFCGARVVLWLLCFALPLPRLPFPRLLDAIDMPRVMSYMGYPTDEDQLRKVINQVDADGSGDFDLVRALHGHMPAPWIKLL